MPKYTWWTLKVERLHIRAFLSILGVTFTLLNVLACLKTQMFVYFWCTVLICLSILEVKMTRTSISKHIWIKKLVFLKIVYCYTVSKYTRSMFNMFGYTSTSMCSMSRGRTPLFWGRSESLGCFTLASITRYSIQHLALMEVCTQ